MSEEKVSIVVSDKGGGMDIPVISPGTKLAVCVGMIHLGTYTEEVLGRMEHKNRVRIVWELPNDKFVFDEERGEESRQISKTYTYSLGDKANLRKDLEAWRGQAFTKEELEGFDITKVVGHGCMLSIATKTSAKNREYNKVNGVAALLEGTKVPGPTQEIVIFSHGIKSNELFLERFELCSEYIQGIIMSSDEWKARGLERPVKNETATQQEQGPAQASDVPPGAAGTPPPF